MTFVVRKDAVLPTRQALTHLKGLRVLQMPVLALAETRVWIIIVDVPKDARAIWVARGEVKPSAGVHPHYPPSVDIRLVTCGRPAQTVCAAIGNAITIDFAGRNSCPIYH